MWAALALCVACSDPGVMSVDGGGSDAGTETRYGPTEIIAELPQAPAPPAFTPCAPGWREVSVEGITICEPWPVGGPTDCGTDEAHFPGEEGCVRIGSECPDGIFATDLPPDRTILHVWDGAAPDGDGSVDLPYTSIGEAITFAEEGDIISLSKGTYDEIVRLPAGVTLWGACVGETTLMSNSAADNEAVLYLLGEGSEARNLRIAGERVGIAAVFGASTRVRDVAVEGAVAVGIAVGGDSTLEAQNVIVRGTRSSSTGRAGRAINVDEGSLHLSRAAIEGNREIGIATTGHATTATVEDTVIRDTIPREADGFFGRAIGVQAGAQMVLQRSALENNRHDCLFVSGAGSSLQVRDLVVRDSQPQNTAGYFGGALSVSSAATADFERVWFERNQGAAVFTSGEGTRFAMDHAFVHQTRGNPNGVGGVGLQVREGAVARVSHTLMAQNHTAGLISLEGALLQVSDTVVRDTLPEEAAGADGRALTLSWGGRAEIERALFERNREFGVAVMSGSTAQLTDVTIVDTLEEESSGEFGRGLHMEAGTRVDALRVQITGSEESAVLLDGEDTVLSAQHLIARGNGNSGPRARHGMGVACQGGARLELTSAILDANPYMGLYVDRPGTVAILDRVWIRGTAPRLSDGYFGHGIQAQHGGVVRGSMVWVEQSHGFGMLALHEGTSIELTDLRVTATLPRACDADPECERAGVGVTSAERASISIERFEVTDNTLCGVQVAAGGTMDLRAGRISGHRVGANVQSADFDFSRLSEGVTFSDNERLLDASQLPLPEEAAPELPNAD